ncbi:EAL domain-containing protein [Pseudidiomarina sp. 1APP75-32.1]|uniref:EAL domain-containing protein n=1 Tax=Pseudidiomarina terrestris TaxID=2820060 RepID=A0AAW7R494_9GAMM|nr:MULTISPECIES: GGDEF domain-containing phosphodiesterase [unclassified Pseudidiomarina]MDN7125329.1 EAL domain-containing protein [Pseudidiomarina sp. 1APP75-32.1]MDN7130088.1 EAL domain-containing protein [Pseudidiomarina sp. 1APR75-15]
MKIGEYIYKDYSWFQRLVLITFLALAVWAVTWLVWSTGGTKYVYYQFMFIPIILSAIIFGFKGALVFAIVASLAIGPAMPVDTQTMEMQKTLNWLYRGGFFLGVGLLSALAIEVSRSYINHIEKACRQDQITLLPNRLALIERLTFLRETKLHKKSTYCPLLFVFSIDNSMALRSAFGFSVIDSIIEDYAQALMSLEKEQAEIYRVHNNQIGAIFTGRDDKNISVLIDKCLACIREYSVYRDISVYVERHCGVVHLNGDEADAANVIQQAEIAIARANEDMLESFIYNSDVGKDISRHLALMADVPKSIEDGDFVMHYQPKIDLKSDTCIGAEALIRWEHPTLGRISPNDFIPHVERSTLIVKLGSFVLNEVICQMAEWQKQGRFFQVAVNITSHDLLRSGFCQMIFDLLQEHNVDGRYLELEITEGTLIANLDELCVKLLRLTKAKITISIDDFGTGYSSLQYLYKLPISLLKIDQVFIKGLPEDLGAMSICTAAITLAQKIGIKTLAEGIETEEQSDFLIELGCDYGQGYLIAKPIAADDFIDWYQSFEAERDIIG